MFSFFRPRAQRKTLADAELIRAGLQRHRIYAQDTLPPSDLAQLRALEAQYPPLLKAKDTAALDQLNQTALAQAERLFPPSRWDFYRENIEVFVVAAIMALAIRTFFLQPFQIPTGSMEPTLFGIEPQPTEQLPPNIVQQVYDFVIKGRSYARVVTTQGGTISQLTPGQFTIWFDYTDVQIGAETHRIWIRPSDVVNKLNLQIGMSFPPGAVLANFVTQTGDKVLVDKVTYNFRQPRRGEVFVFKTAGIPDLRYERGPDQEGSDDFIKRCVGLAGDLIDIQPPLLLINKQPATGSPAFAQEFNKTGNYPGYTIGEDGRTSYYVPVDCYWAMGDNSPYSKDSRYWGGVPYQNLIGRGYFVFWPFTERWGWIR